MVNTNDRLFAICEPIGSLLKGPGRPLFMKVNSRRREEDIIYLIY